MRRLNALYRQVMAGRPVSSAELAALGVSADLAVHYVRAGWLIRLARGLFARPEAPLELAPSLRALNRLNPSLHVGGASALDWHGVRHQVAQRPVLHLYGWDATKLPNWFSERFPSTYQRKRLFDEPATTPLRVHPFQRKSDAPLVSDPERAVLEVLSDVGVRQTLKDARDLVEAASSLRASVLQELLARCTQVKTVRLCLTLGRELGHPWAAKLDRDALPTGSSRRWVSRSEEGLLVLKP
jgi:Transcriptional regulator, AbiEi antitoxin, Type IV TA system/Transcriptional regulator, AbiEi antitoxin N-terminal domain